MTSVLAGCRLLLIDDDAGFARLAGRTLGRLGFDVVHAADGDAGLGRLDSEGFDAVVLDHVMPGRSGMDTLAAICARAAPPPVIYVTGADEGRVAVAALKAGAADYVLKDGGGEFFDLLARTIHAAIETHRLRAERAAAQAEIAAARDRAELLLREVNHRVANSLALVASLAHLQAQALPEGEGRAAMHDFHRRVVAIGQVHRRLYTSRDVSHVDVEAYLAALVEELRDSLAAEGCVSDILFEGEACRVPTDRAVAIGVIVSELVTNACKYAYPGDARGPVRVRLLCRDGIAELDVADEGVGLDPARVEGTGLGSRILAAMARSIRGTVIRPETPRGTTVRLRFAL